ncbi:MAG: hypothetical protein ACHWZW_11165 [Spirulina sp.]
MQIPENPSNNDIRDALINLQDLIGEVRNELRNEVRSEIEDVRRDIKDLSDKVDKQDYKFDAYQKGTDGMVRMAITIIIATATVVVIPSLSPAITALINALTNTSL